MEVTEKKKVKGEKEKRKKNIPIKKVYKAITGASGM